MTKTEAVKMFGNSRRKLAEALGITTQAVGQWPEQLSQRVADRTLGALYRTKKRKAKQNGIAAVRTDRP